MSLNPSHDILSLISQYDKWKNVYKGILKNPRRVIICLCTKWLSYKGKVLRSQHFRKHNIILSSLDSIMRNNIHVQSVDIIIHHFVTLPFKAV